MASHQRYEHRLVDTLLSPRVTVPFLVGSTKIQAQIVPAEP